jgi:hypothetical protein
MDEGFESFEVVAVNDHVARLFAYGGIWHSLKQSKRDVIDVVHDVLLPDPVQLRHATPPR